MSTQTAPTAYQPPNQAGAASAFQSGAASLAQGGQQVQNTALPGFLQLFSGAQNNPFYGGAQTGAGQVAQLGGPLGQSQIGAGQQLQTLSGQLQSYAPGILQTGFDPQNALYNQQYQVNQQQQDAINAANGVAGSPYGAGLAGQSGQQFNLGWGNNQQGRELAALSGVQGLASTASGLSQAGAGLEGQGLNTIGTSSAAPSQTYTQNQDQIAQMLNALVSGDTSAFDLTQNSVTDQGAYLNTGIAAASSADQAAQINNQETIAGINGVFNLLGKIAGSFASGGGGG